MEVREAHGAPRLLIGMCQCGQQQRDEQHDHGDHDQQLDQRETASGLGGAVILPGVFCLFLDGYGDNVGHVGLPARPATGAVRRRLG